MIMRVSFILRRHSLTHVQRHGEWIFLSLFSYVWRIIATDSLAKHNLSIVYSFTCVSYTVFYDFFFKPITAGLLKPNNLAFRGRWNDLAVLCEIKRDGLISREGIWDFKDVRGAPVNPRPAHYKVPQTGLRVTHPYEYRSQTHLVFE